MSDEEEDADVRVRGDVPRSLVEQAREYIAAGGEDEISMAELQRYVFRRFVEDRELDRMRATGRRPPQSGYQEDE